jgi:hypothetical protein
VMSLSQGDCVIVVIVNCVQSYFSDKPTEQLLNFIIKVHQFPSHYKSTFLLERAKKLNRLNK